MPKDWDVVGLGIVGDEFFPILLKILEWETVLGTLEMLLHYYKNNFTRDTAQILRRRSQNPTASKNA